MRTLIGLTLLGLVLGLFGCGSSNSVQMPDNPTPPPAKGPQSATSPGGAGQQRLD